MTPAEALTALRRAYQHLLFAHQQLRGVSAWSGSWETNSHAVSGAADEILEAQLLLHSACTALGVPPPRGVQLPSVSGGIRLRGAELFDWLAVGSTMKELERLLETVVELHATHRERLAPTSPALETEALPDVYFWRLFALVALAASLVASGVLLFKSGGD
ncbi:hypothetical protein [Archangium sp.]|uniref:hypothetical protein n=1 Tax=Archangium sp. TaxID=1872627 RepID=UPI002ED9D152